MRKKRSQTVALIKRTAKIPDYHDITFRLHSHKKSMLTEKDTQMLSDIIGISSVQLAKGMQAIRKGTYYE